MLIPNAKWIRVADPVMDISLPEIPCCYALYFDGRLRYVGQTTNLRQRFNAHVEQARYSSWVVTEWGQFRNASLKYKPSVTIGDWAMHEVRMIHRLQPDLNCLGSIRKRRSA